MKKGENMKRVVVYVEDKDYRQLRSELIMQGVSASEWVRNKIKEFFKQK